MAGKADIVDHLASEVEGLTKRQAGEALDAVVGYITANLGDVGDRVQVPDLGTFNVSHRKERQGRNPQTGAAMTIAASNSVRFKPAKGLKDSVNN